jgi:hypothetical protein
MKIFDRPFSTVNPSDGLESKTSTNKQIRSSCTIQNLDAYFSFISIINIHLINVKIIILISFGIYDRIICP